MDQNSNVNPQRVLGKFAMKFGPKTLKHPWSISLKTLGNFEITILKYNGKSIFLLLILDENTLNFSGYVIIYTFQSHMLSELILDLMKCPNQKAHESESAGFLL